MRSRLWPFLFCLAASCATLTAMAQNLGSLSGVILDSEGQPLQNVALNLTTEQLPSWTARGASDSKGRYRFGDLAPGEYHLSVNLADYQKPATQNFTISRPGENITLDFTLKRTVSLPTGDVGNSSPAPPKFEAAGIRGLIDPGGYSASANAGAASGVLKGMADLKRVEDGLESFPSSASCEEENELLAASSASPGNARASQKLGDFHLAHEQAAQALSELERAQTLDPTDAGIIHDLASAQIRNGQFEKAKLTLSRLGAEQVDGRTRRLLAQADEGLGTFKEASSQYELAFEQEPNDENLFGNGYELILAGSPASAGEVFRHGLLRFPNSLALLVGMGAAEYLQGHAPESIPFFLQAIDLSPSDPRAYRFLASTLGTRESDNGKVREAFRKYAEKWPGRAEALYFYALSLWTLRRAALDFNSTQSPEIELLLKRVVQVSPDFSKAHSLLGTLYYDRRNYQDAVTEYETAVGLEPKLKQTHYSLANAYRLTGRKALAAEQMRLFRETPDGGTDNDIEEFLSVIVPRHNAANDPPSCPPNISR